MQWSGIGGTEGKIAHGLNYSNMDCGCGKWSRLRKGRFAVASELTPARLAEIRAVVEKLSGVSDEDCAAIDLLAAYDVLAAKLDYLWPTLTRVTDERNVLRAKLAALTAPVEGLRRYSVGTLGERRSDDDDLLSYSHISPVLAALRAENDKLSRAASWAQDCLKTVQAERDAAYAWGRADGIEG